MTGLGWILLVGSTGWLTGKLFGATGYGKVLSSYVVDSLDIILGIVGAWIGSYLFYWAVLDEVWVFRYATSMVGAVTLVGISRLVSTSFTQPLTGKKPYRYRRLKNDQQ